MSNEVSQETRVGTQVNIVDADGNVIAESVLDYEVADFLRLRVDPVIAAGCTTVLSE